MKTCFKCQQTLPYSMFYRHAAMKDGHLGKCKECTKNDVKANYSANRDRYAEYERQRANLPHRVEAKKRYAKTADGKAALRRGSKAWVERNPSKRAAQVILGNAMRDGKIARQSCAICGAKAQAHHDDYTKPLEVIWLCSKHHSALHREKRRGAAT